jgi:hypothetical protein
MTLHLHTVQQAEGVFSAGSAIAGEADMARVAIIGIKTFMLYRGWLDFQ